MTSADEIVAFAHQFNRTVNIGHYEVTKEDLSDVPVEFQTASFYEQLRRETTAAINKVKQEPKPMSSALAALREFDQRPDTVALKKRVQAFEDQQKQKL